MTEVFQKEVIEITKQKMNNALVKLKQDKLLQRKFRELADMHSRLNRIVLIIKGFSNTDEDRQKWIKKRNALAKKQEEIYSALEKEGFEPYWVTTIVEYERKNLDKLIDVEREKAKKKHLGHESIKDIDIFDNRLNLIREQIEQVKKDYIGLLSRKWTLKFDKQKRIKAYRAALAMALEMKSSRTLLIISKP